MMALSARVNGRTSSECMALEKATITISKGRDGDQLPLNFPDLPLPVLIKPGKGKKWPLIQQNIIILQGCSCMETGFGIQRGEKDFPSPPNYFYHNVSREDISWNDRSSLLPTVPKSSSSSFLIGDQSEGHSFSS